MKGFPMSQGVRRGGRREIRAEGHLPTVRSTGLGMASRFPEFNPVPTQ